MNFKEDAQLTSSELTYLIIGAIVDVGLLIIPNSSSIFAKQDAWISVFLGVCYPLYVVLLSVYISKNFPNDHILVISKKYLGKFLGNILNIGFSLVFLFYLVSSISALSNLLRTYVVSFLSPFRFISVILFLSLYTAYKGIKPIARISQIVFFITSTMLLVPLSSFATGDILNLIPIFDVNLLGIFKGTISSVYPYGGVEVLLLFYPLLLDKSKVKYSSVKAISIVCIIYTWITFITIYYLGIYVIPKTLWGSIYAFESLNIKFINNFRLFIIFFFILITFRTSAIHYYSFTAVIEDLLSNANKLMIYLLIYPPILLVTIRYSNENIRRAFVDSVAPFLTVFSVVYITLIALLIFIKKDKKYEKK